MLEMQKIFNIILKVMSSKEDCHDKNIRKYEFS